MNKNPFYLMALAITAMSDGKQHRRIYGNSSPKRTCKDCYFYMGGTYCKRVKHHVNKQIPANGCVYFKKK